MDVPDMVEEGEGRDLGRGFVGEGTPRPWRDREEEAAAAAATTGSTSLDRSSYGSRATWGQTKGPS